MKKIALILEWSTDAQSQHEAALHRLLGNEPLVSDQDVDLLIADNEQNAETIRCMLDDVGIGYETMEVILLPQDAKLRDSFTDFGVVTPAGHVYIFTQLAAVFRLSGAHPQSPQSTTDEPHLAEQQLEEHLLASFIQQPYVWYVIERHLLTLAEGIARAYGCSVITAAP